MGDRPPRMAQRRPGHARRAARAPRGRHPPGTAVERWRRLRRLAAARFVRPVVRRGLRQRRAAAGTCCRRHRRAAARAPAA